MHDPILISGRDTLLVAIPFLLFFLAAIFRLDEAVLPTHRIAKHHQTCGLDAYGEPILSDPDGHIVQAHSKTGK